MSPKLVAPAQESWLWEAACVIWRPLDAPKIEDYILPLIFLKRLYDGFDDEIDTWPSSSRIVGPLPVSRGRGRLRENTDECFRTSGSSCWRLLKLHP